jgi:membrane fusion protein, heavy metal efflux system
MNRRWIFLLLGSLVLAGCEGRDVEARKVRNTDPPEVRLRPELLASGQVQVEPVTATSETTTIRTSGKVGFNEERLSYVSSPLVGRVVDIRARPGDRVAAGQTLAVIDSSDLGTAWSEFIKARADLILAERGHKLAQELWAAKAMAAKDFQKAEDEFVKAKTDLRRTRERLLSLGVPEAELDAPLDALHVRSQLNLIAPINGTVIERTLTLGQMLGGDPPPRLFVIADLTTLWVAADIYEKDLPLIRPDEEVRVQAAAWPDEQFNGRIDYVGDTVDATSRTIKVRATVDNQQLKLKPEMFVTATVYTTGSTAMLSVPLVAVHGEGTGQSYVFSVLDDDRVVRRPVTLGAKWDGRVAITAGLSPQDRVVTSGSILLKAEADRQADG